MPGPSITAPLLVMLLLLGACAAGDPLGVRPEGSLVPAAAEPAIQTDSSLYHVSESPGGYTATIGLTFVNRTGGTVEIPACHTPHPPILEKRVRDEWVVAYDPPVLLCVTPPVVIRPGRSYQYTYRVVAGHTGSNSYPQFQVEEIGGTYRLRWRALLRSNGQQQPLPEEHSVSNEFELRG